MATVTHPYIVGDASVCGGSPRINGTRITVRTVVIATLLHGQTPEQLLQHYPHLSLATIVLLPAWAIAILALTANVWNRYES